MKSLREDLLGCVGPLKLKKQIRKRIEIVIQAIQDGCVDCVCLSSSGGVPGLCHKHRLEVGRLCVDPKVELPRLENEIFGEMQDGNTC